MPCGDSLQSVQTAAEIGCCACAVDKCQSLIHCAYPSCHIYPNSTPRAVIRDEDRAAPAYECRIEAEAMCASTDYKSQMCGIFLKLSPMNSRLNEKEYWSLKSWRGHSSSRQSNEKGRLPKLWSHPSVSTSPRT
jgi:hypothetical protein